jgi:hypothetical protein
MAISLKSSGLFKAFFGQILGSVLWDHEHVPARAHMSHSEKIVVETMIYFSLQRIIADYSILSSGRVDVCNAGAHAPILAFTTGYVH